MAIILVDGKPFEYKEESLSDTNAKPIKEVDARNILDLSKKLTKEKGLDFFLFFGTLLGAVRDKGLIPGDEDVDVATMDEKKLVSLIPYLYENGLKIIRHRSGVLYSFRSDNDCYIDFYIVRPIKRSLWSLWCYHAGIFVIEKKHFRKFKELQFLGGDYLVPADCEAILERLYGKTWRIPQKGHAGSVWHTDVESYYIWKNYIVPYTKHYLCEIVGWKYWQHLVRKNAVSKKNYIERSNNSWNRYKERLSKRKK